MRYLRNFIFALIITFLAITLLMLLPSPQPDAVKPWEVVVMPDGNPQFLGIHLGSTTYGEAQKKVGIFGHPALFSDPDGKLSVEAFFESINLGGLSAKLVLTLALTDEALATIKNRATAGKLQPSRARQHELSEQDKLAIQDAAVKSITYIPTVRLNESILLSRFGEPTHKETIKEEDGEASQQWFYPQLNMEVRLRPGHKSVLLLSAK